MSGPSIYVDADACPVKGEVVKVAERHGLALPIAEAGRDVLHGDLAPAEALSRLLARERKAEYPEGLFGS